MIMVRTYLPISFVDFIDKNKDDPFFIYYPMALVHDPFLPTPDSDDWNDLEKETNEINQSISPTC